MSLTGIVGTVAAVYVLDKLSDSDEDHDDVLLDTYETVDKAVSEDASIYVDHIDVDADGNARSADAGTDRVPDLVVQSFADNNIAVEVETSDSLDDDAVDQLADFAKPGYTRALVVPGDVVDDGAMLLEEFTDSDTANVVVCGPTDVADLL